MPGTSVNKDRVSKIVEKTGNTRMGAKADILDARAKRKGEKIAELQSKMVPSFGKSDKIKKLEKQQGRIQKKAVSLAFNNLIRENLKSEGQLVPKSASPIKLNAAKVSRVAERTGLTRSAAKGRILQDRAATQQQRALRLKGKISEGVTSGKISTDKYSRLTDQLVNANTKQRQFSQGASGAYFKDMVTQNTRKPKPATGRSRTMI